MKLTWNSFYSDYVCSFLYLLLFSTTEIVGLLLLLSWVCIILIGDFMKSIFNNLYTSKSIFKYRFRVWHYLNFYHEIRKIKFKNLCQESIDSMICWLGRLFIFIPCLSLHLVFLLIVFSKNHWKWWHVWIMSSEMNPL